MADPQHVAIVKAGKKHVIEMYTIDDLPPGDISLDLSGADLRRLELREMSLKHVNLRGADLTGACLRRVNFEGAILGNTILKKAILDDSGFDAVDMHGANLADSTCDGTFFRCADLAGASLRRACLSGTNFDSANLEGADLTDAELSVTQFLSANLRNAKLHGVKIGEIVTREWDITGVECSHFYTRNNQETFIKSLEIWQRIPQVGSLRPGEFEDRYKSRPTIEFIFKDGMQALDPALLASAIEQINKTNPKYGLRILTLDARGGLPRAIIEVAVNEIISEAEKLVRREYDHKVKLLKESLGAEREQNVFLRKSLDRVLMPAPGPQPSFISAAELADHYGVDKGRLRKRLERFRKNNLLTENAFVECENPAHRTAKFLYNTDMVKPLIQRMQSQKTGVKRASAKKK